eukprot:767085-Hanusia_phi.AAC.1
MGKVTFTEPTACESFTNTESAAATMTSLTDGLSFSKEEEDEYVREEEEKFLMEGGEEEMLRGLEGVRRIGAGSFGTVYAVQRKDQPEKMMALKVRLGEGMGEERRGEERRGEERRGEERSEE